MQKLSSSFIFLLSNRSKDESAIEAGNHQIWPIIILSTCITVDVQKKSGRINPITVSHDLDSRLSPTSSPERALAGFATSPFCLLNWD
jgi:hypothetical protein